MTRPVHLAALRRALLASAFLACAPMAGAAELPLSRVVLSSSGLGQFTHSGSVTGGTNVDLAVRLDQVDDILKSLTVLDAQGALGAVSLPGKAPLQELFRDLPFGPEALQSPTALLNAMVGSEVELTGQVGAKGRIFRVEEEASALPNNAGTTTKHRLTLMTDNGLMQALVEDVSALRFTEPAARAQIERALTGLAENRAKDRRRVSIGFLGTGTRRAAISYVVAAPVWKTAYRLVLPKDGAKARLQGWAVLENLTGGDWKDVELVLVSGNPVALRQPLYTAFFADRPEIPVATTARLVPRTDDGDTEARPAPQVGQMAQPARAVASRDRTRALSVAPAQLARTGQAYAAPGSAPAGEAEEPVVGLTESEEASTQLLYRFPTKLSLATGHTMMVPFVDREISATRTWLYQPDVAARRPLAAVRLRNDSESGLPAGIVTAFDGGADGNANFAGDAQLPLLPRGMVKFITFALDSRTDIRRDDRGATQTTLGKAVNGVLTRTTRSRRVVDYEVTAPAEEDREIVVEEPRVAGWQPAAGGPTVEETPTRLRHTITAAKGKVTKASLALERVDTLTVTLTSMAPEEMLTQIRGLQNESAALKEAVAQLGGIIQEINRARARRTELGNERKKIGDDQERIRRNLSSVGGSTDLGRRYVDTLRLQEERLVEIERTEQSIEAEIAGKRQAAEELVRKLTI